MRERVCVTAASLKPAAEEREQETGARTPVGKQAQLGWLSLADREADGVTRRTRGDPRCAGAGRVVETSRTELERITFSYPIDPDQQLQPNDESTYDENSSLALERAATHDDPELRKRYPATVKGRQCRWIAKQSTTVDKFDEILELDKMDGPDVSIRCLYID